MKRSTFNVSYIFSPKPLFFEKNEIKWNQTDRHFSQFKSFPIKWNQIDNVFVGAHKVEILGHT